MNWIILLLAGLFEVSLTFCLGKARAASGVGFYFVGKRFPCLYHTEHDFACQSGTDFAFGNCVRHLDGNRSGWYGFDWDIRFQGTCHSHPAFLPFHAHCILDRIENRVILKGDDK